MIRSRQRIAWRCGWLGLLVVAGCGPAKTEVSGTVRYQGKPLTSGDVLVVDADGMPHTSPISAEGAYTARDVPVGPVRFAVLLVGNERRNTSKLPKREPGKRRAKIDVSKLDDKGTAAKPQLPPRYAAVGTSGLSTTLQPGPNTFDLDLE
jgi:hypothetical protein